MKNKIQELRKAKGLTQEDLAELCDTSTAQIQRLESGKRQLNTKWIERLSKALEVPPASLFAQDDAPLKTRQQNELDSVFRRLSQKDQALLLDIAKTLETHNRT